MVVERGYNLDKNIFWFQIPVNHSALVQVADSRNQLLHNLNYVRFSDLIVLQELKKLSAVNLLHHNEHPAFGLVDFSHFNHVWMAKKTDNLDFVTQKLLFALV